MSAEWIHCAYAQITCVLFGFMLKVFMYRLLTASFFMFGTCRYAYGIFMKNYLSYIITKTRECWLWLVCCWGVFQPFFNLKDYWWLEVMNNVSKEKLNWRIISSCITTALPSACCLYLLFFVHSELCSYTDLFLPETPSDPTHRWEHLSNIMCKWSRARRWEEGKGEEKNY